MSNSTITIQNVLDYARAHVRLKPVMGLGGVANEPGLSIANDVIQILTNRPFAPKFNRKSPGFFCTQPFTQNYNFAGAVAFALNPPASGNSGFQGGGGAGIDLASNSAITASGQTITVNTLDPHPFQTTQTVYMNGNTQAGFNSTFTQNNISLTSS